MKRKSGIGDLTEKENRGRSRVKLECYKNKNKDFQIFRLKNLLSPPVPHVPR